MLYSVMLKKLKADIMRQTSNWTDYTTFLLNILWFKNAQEIYLELFKSLKISVEVFEKIFI